jgi:hypothetical protein
VNKPIAFIAFIFLTACQTPQNFTPIKIESDSTYTQQSTGISFPREIYNFSRVEITQFDEAGSDIAVGYNSKEPLTPIAVTIYSYPAPTITSFGSPPEVIETARKTLFNNHYSTLKQDINYAHKDVKLINEEQITITQISGKLTGLKSTFEYNEYFAGSYQKVQSELYLFESNENLLKYRVTSPSPSYNTEQIKSLMQSFLVRN